jgi:hypothetical protein
MLPTAWIQPQESRFITGTTFTIDVGQLLK